MFMVKDEYANIKNLLKVKIKTTAKSFKWFLIVSAIMFPGTLFPAIYSVLQDNGNVVMPHTISDFSSSFFFGMVIVYLIFMITYRQINEYLSVLPQTNNSRFITTLFLNYIFAVFVGLTAILIYLLDYGVLKLLSLYKDNVYFALNFNTGFIITGFFTFLMYSFLIIAAFGLIGAILRKWKYYAVVAFAVILSLMIANIRWIFENIPKIFAFIVKEPVPVWFMLKGISLWLVITATSLVINYYTLYYKSQRKTTTAGVAFICIIMAIITMIVPAAILFNVSTETNRATIQEIQYGPGTDYYSDFMEIRIDVSHLPKGSKLNVEGENIGFPGLNGEYVYKDNALYLSGMDELNSLQGNAIIIYYRFLIYRVNGLEVFKYANPKLNAYLDGDTLHIDYTFENAHVIILPVWGIAGQFDCYKDKGVLPKNPWGYGSGNSGNGNINIKVE